MSKLSYIETSRPKDWAMPILLGTLSCYLAYLITYELFISEGYAVSSLVIISLGILICLGTLWYLTHTRILIKSSKKGLKVKKLPFGSSDKIEWDTIAKCESSSPELTIEQPNRYLPFWLEKKYTLTGRSGIHILTKNGRRLFIGTKKPKKLKRIVHKGMERAK